MRSLSAALLLVILATSCGKDRNPVIPQRPSTGQLLFYGYGAESTFTHIFSINADGTSLRQLTADSLNDRYPRWSPDGTKIVFIRQYRGSRDSANVTVMNADGSDIVRLTFDSGDESPSWSADGSQIAYQHDELFRRDVWVVNANGSNPHLFMSADSTNSAQEITWTRENTLLGYDAYGIDIQPTPAATRFTRVLNLFPLSGAGPRLSPNGTTIAFAWEGPYANEGPYIYTVGADGTGMIKISNMHDRSPVWSPSGSEIAFVRDSRIWVMDSNGGNAARVTGRIAPGSDYLGDWK